MPRFRRLAVERLLAFLAALAVAIGGTTAQAQEDPFALPKGVTAQSVAAAQGPGLSEISIDGNVRSRLVELAWRGGDLMIAADGARVAGLPVPDESPAMISLSALKLAKSNFDSVTSVSRWRCFGAAMGPTRSICRPRSALMGYRSADGASGQL